jgi:plasmid replication initiation protein
LRVTLNRLLAVLAVATSVIILINAVYIAFTYWPDRAFRAGAEAVSKEYDDLAASMRDVLEKQNGVILRYRERERHLYGVLHTLLWMSQTGYPNKAATIVDMFISYQETIVEAIEYMEAGE